MSIGYLPGAICSGAARGFIAVIAFIGIAAATTYGIVSYGLVSCALFAGPIIAAMVLKAGIVWLLQRRWNAAWTRYEAHRKIRWDLLTEHPSYYGIDPGTRIADLRAWLRSRDEYRASYRQRHPEWAERLAKAEDLCSKSDDHRERCSRVKDAIEYFPLGLLMTIVMLIIAIAS